MEVYNQGIAAENPKVSIPDGLTKEKTLELVKEGNSFAFEEAKKDFIQSVAFDPLILPILISSLTSDWVFKNHNFTQDQFKTALFTHKVYEDTEIAKLMGEAQAEIVQLCTVKNKEFTLEVDIQGDE